jgi:hypothetical protein
MVNRRATHSLVQIVFANDEQPAVARDAATSIASLLCLAATSIASLLCLDITCHRPRIAFKRVHAGMIPIAFYLYSLETKVRASSSHLFCSE